MDPDSKVPEGMQQAWERDWPPVIPEGTELPACFSIAAVPPSKIVFQPTTHTAALSRVVYAAPKSHKDEFDVTDGLDGRRDQRKSGLCACTGSAKFNLDKVRSRNAA